MRGIRYKEMIGLGNIQATGRANEADAGQVWSKNRLGRCTGGKHKEPIKQ